MPAKKTSTSGYDAGHPDPRGLELFAAPGMYIGDTGGEGLHHLVWEIIDNAVDEAAAGFAATIDVVLHGDGSIEVHDDGRGIPIDRKSDGRTALEVVFTELHAGGKFGSGAYTSSGGLHGVGASVVNALAQKLVAEVDRDGATHILGFNERVAGQFANGSPAPAASRRVMRWSRPSASPTRPTGCGSGPTSKSSIPTPSSTSKRSVGTTQACFLVPGMKVTVTDKRSASGQASTRLGEPFSFVVAVDSPISSSTCRPAS